jgi:hypothetical protein
MFSQLCTAYKCKPEMEEEMGCDLLEQLDAADEKYELPNHEKSTSRRTQMNQGKIIEDVEMEED